MATSTLHRAEIELSSNGRLDGTACTCSLQRPAHLLALSPTRYAEGDVVWTTEKVWQYARFVGFGAIAAGMLGVGGGMILAPIFNELNFHPQVRWCCVTSDGRPLVTSDCRRMSSTSIANYE